MKPKILSVRMEHKIDENPDTNCLGHYSNRKDETSNRFTIDRVARGDCGRNEYAYFTPGSVEICDPCADWIQKELKIAKAFGIKTDAETVWFNAMTNNAEKDYARMEALNRGDWNYLGVIAKTEIQLADGSPIQTIHSGGLWGVESDSGDYLKEVAREQLAELKTELLAIGFKKRAIEYAFGKVEL